MKETGWVKVSMDDVKDLHETFGNSCFKPSNKGVVDRSLTSKQLASKHQVSTSGGPKTGSPKAGRTGSQTPATPKSGTSTPGTPKSKGPPK